MCSTTLGGSTALRAGSTSATSALWLNFLNADRSCFAAQSSAFSTVICRDNCQQSNPATAPINPCAKYERDKQLRSAYLLSYVPVKV